MTNVTIVVPTSDVPDMRRTSQRLAGLLVNQITSCELTGPPLVVTIVAAIPDERVNRVRDIASTMGVSCSL